MLSDCSRWYPEPLGASRSHHQSSAERVRAAAGCTTRTLRRARRARPAAPEAITARRAPDSARERKGRVLRRKGVTRAGPGPRAGPSLGLCTQLPGRGFRRWGRSGERFRLVREGASVVAAVSATQTRRSPPSFTHSALAPALPATLPARG
ncbi:hypothetical protein CapIbe_012521 [Capra ibex]